MGQTASATLTHPLEAAFGINLDAPYQTREWRLHRFPTNVSPELMAIGIQVPPLGQPYDEYVVANKPGAFAPNTAVAYVNVQGKVTRRFFNTPEQLAASIREEHLTGCNGDMLILAEDWNGHKKGALVHRIGDGVGYHILTYMVEVI